ncbi:MAG: 50S ribosomal protein L15 [Tepidiforma sp.]|nr:50S ribosomal protein L15 [Tepidiforma sp.]GIW19359.1 MAG: 50S ribosomal protein L15 [Tepidiforma sp.]
MFGAHELRPPRGATHAKKRVGRGNSSGHGTYAGRGLKGQRSRSGKKLAYDAFEGGQFPTSRKFHVLRGFNNKWRVPFQPVNLEALERFADGTEVTPEMLKQAGILKHLREPVKILGRGELTRKLTVAAHAFSATAKERIESAGGTAVVISDAPEKDR